jgi:protein subunit release factor A
MLRIQSKFFCIKVKQKLVSQIEQNGLKLPNLTLQILKYLENNQIIYERLCEESTQLAYEASKSELLKNELMRVNKQIHEFSKENYYYDEYKESIQEILSNMILYNEAIEINDKDIAEQATTDITKYKNKLEELKDEVIEFLIPESSVYLYNNR